MSYKKIYLFILSCLVMAITAGNIYAGTISRASVWLNRVQDESSNIKYFFFTDIWGTVSEFQNITVTSPLNNTYPLSLAPEGDQWEYAVEDTEVDITSEFVDGIYTFDVTYTDTTTDSIGVQLGGDFPNFPTSLSLNGNTITWDSWVNPVSPYQIEIEVSELEGDVVAEDGDVAGAHLAYTETSFTLPTGFLKNNTQYEIEVWFVSSEYPDGFKASVSSLTTIIQDPKASPKPNLSWLMLLLDNEPNLPVCGNGKLEADEECDDGNNDNLDTCLDTCVSASCGDGFTQSGVETCDDGNLEDGDGCEYDCTITEKDRVVFLTSIEYTGNLGGLAGADTICNQLASDAQLSGTYKAWLSDDTTSVADRFTHHGQFVLVNESPVATSWSDLTDASIINPIIMDENGDTHAGETVWGNTDWDGSREIYAESCLNWTKESYDSIQDIYRGRGVYSDHNDYRWSYPSPSIPCDRLHRFYCFEQ